MPIKNKRSGSRRNICQERIKESLWDQGRIADIFIISFPVAVAVSSVRIYFSMIKVNKFVSLFFDGICFLFLNWQIMQVVVDYSRAGLFESRLTLTQD